MRLRSLFTATALLLLALPTVAAELAPFDATFNVIWRGMGAGTAKLTLARKGDTWRYESHNNARGIFKVAIPGEISQSSEFRLIDGRIVPHHFTTDDGTKQGKRNTDITFDWNAKRASGTAEGKTVDAAIEPGTQDTLSVQLALIHELTAGRTPKRFVLFDGDEVKDYEYIAEGKERVETALGSHETLKFRSKRPDSDRSTVFWCAPELGYLPVKVERQRGAKIEWSMAMTALKRD